MTRRGNLKSDARGLYVLAKLKQPVRYLQDDKLITAKASTLSLANLASVPA